MAHSAVIIWLLGKQTHLPARTAVAKDKFLTDMPKKPLGHLQLYFRDKVKELKKAGYFNGI